MQVIRDLIQAHSAEPTILTIGTFDGVHRGHQALIKQLKTNANRYQQAQTAVIAFYPPPRAILAPHKEHASHDYLTTAEERIARFQKLGLDLLILIPFTQELSETTAYNFMKQLVEQLNLAELWVGYDFALGKNREGTFEKLTTLGQEFNYTVFKIPPLIIEKQTVSSSYIRKLLRVGQVRQATKFLGYYPTITSKIIKGSQRGRTIGFPTANFAIPPKKLIPANGVYATFMSRQGEADRYASVTNVGMRPSFDSQERSIETYIFDFEKDIYHQEWTLEFVEYLRPERKFDSLEELKNQIHYDSEKARNLLLEKVHLPEETDF